MKAPTLLHVSLLTYKGRLLRNLYAGQEATVRTGHGTTDWLQIGKGVRQGCKDFLLHTFVHYWVWGQTYPGGMTR